MTLESLSLAVQIGLLYAVPALAVTLAFRVTGFPDLTPDGSFTLGAAVAGILILNGYATGIAVILAVTAGMAAGALTAILHVRLGISKLLAGILVMTMLYSLSLRTMNTSNLSLRGSEAFIGALSDSRNPVWPLIIILAFVGCIGASTWAFLRTNFGIRLRAAGDSDTALEQIGIGRAWLYIAGLAIANGLAGLGGAVVAQYQGFVDVSMGAGLVIICLAAIVIGETVLRPEGVATLLAAPVLGMVIYQCAIALALRLGLAASDLKVATAVIALLFVALDRLRIQSGQRSRQIGNRNI